MAYNPQVPPQTLDDLIVFVHDELLRIAQSYNNMVDGLYEIMYKPPVRVKPGMVVYADGTSWNPGAGEGLYRRSLSNTWVFIG